jgi:hypothetical protein
VVAVDNLNKKGFVRCICRAKARLGSTLFIYIVQKRYLFDGDHKYIMTATLAVAVLFLNHPYRFRRFLPCADRLLLGFSCNARL